MSNLKTKRIQLGDHATASNNFVIRQPDTPNGNMVISNGTIDSNTDLVTVTSDGNVTVSGTVTTTGDITTSNRIVSTKTNDDRQFLINPNAGYGSYTIDDGTYTTYYGQARLAGHFNSQSQVGDATIRGYNGVSISGNAGNNGIRVDNAGRLNTPYQPSFHAYSPAATGTNAYVVYASTRSNIGSHYSTSTGTFTAPVAGTYHFTYNALMNANTGQPYVRLYFDVNGTHDATYGDTLAGGYTNAWDGWSYISVTNSMTIYLSANDTVRVWNDGPHATYGPNYGTFSGFLVG